VVKEVTGGAIYRGKSPSGVVASSWVMSPTETKIPSRFGVDLHLSQFLNLDLLASEVSSRFSSN
jgi:hypothetical protein